MINKTITGISNALYKEFGYENHMEEIKQDLKEPCFFIGVLNPSLKKYPGGRYKSDNSFIIQYFPKRGDSAAAECYSVAERMGWCLEIITADGVPLRGSGMRYEITDGILHFFVSYNFFIYKLEQHETMGSLKSHTNIKKAGG